MGTLFESESRIVVGCARAGLSGERAPLERLAPDSREVDWPTVGEIAARHGIASLVFDALRRCPSDTVPDEAREAFRERSRRAGQRNLQLFGEVASLSSAFADERIRAIPYRGPVIAQIAYGDVGHREFGDLDFLVSQSDLRAARSILLERGYEPIHVIDSTDELSAGQEAAYVRFTRDYQFFHPSKGIEVELHWRVVNRRFPTAFELEAVWDRRSSLSVAGTDVPVLSPEDRLLLCCVHGTRHRWERLQWSCDVAAYLRNHSFDWTDIVRRAREHHCERMLYLGLAVVADLYDADLPDPIRRAIDRDPAIDSLTREVYDRLFEDDVRWQVDTWRYQSKTIDRYRDRGRFWARCLLIPGHTDIESVSLPRPLVSLYAAVRVLRFGREAANRLVRDEEPSSTKPGAN